MPFTNCSDPNTFCIDQLELYEFPGLTIPNNTINLVLVNNSISTLNKDSFERLAHLEVIVLSDNKITDIPPGTFRAQKKLTYLDLSHNNLSSITGEMLVGLESHTKLKISGNSLQTISPQTFLNLPKLETLVVDLKTLNSQKDIFTNPDSKFPPEIVPVLEENYLKCDNSNCWLKRLESKGMFQHYMKDGELMRPKCENVPEYWDEVDLHCTGKFVTHIKRKV